ncbi:bifunctional methylenetetrahydrofolate dehydrogenase/methenyltetrahydrofolate cyclohydrolase FolD [Candidatus Laterigemmans baculatus]|uniref:bifunctional methylenetetrahydrofolate dehydrogenase/methenyltetrahydrofolate cyclohydrolase FolD n=1 Tax=Candidatus Laterigemmans baculatus TaxID=2770505 RepID=UPI0013DA5CA9|nr:bifunctional methylenetetrahydrofolate dehydrogenase/methenyltetrahydrofolate cyclohydrolase FolD [Candidatus Laterigemmans baculatus]
MTARILDGKQIASEIRAEIARDVAALLEAGGPRPGLAAVLVGDNPASEVYVRNKQRACERAGIDSRLHRLDAAAGDARLLELIEQLNADPTVHGILVQLPLPRGFEERAVLDAVDPLKDVDAFSPENVGLLVQGRPRFLPCTPHGVIQLLHRCQIPVAGRHAVVVGRSEIVGKPMALLLAARDGTCGPEACNATVTLAHSRSENLAEIVRSADIVVAAVGRPQMIRGEMLKPGCTVIDVGINRVGDALVGDVHFEEAAQVAGAITPVPGGVGPLTIAMLLSNTLASARKAVNS